MVRNVIHEDFDLKRVHLDLGNLWWDNYLHVIENHFDHVYSIPLTFI